MRAGRTIGILMMLWMLPFGCTPESEILFGVWQSKVDVPGYSADGEELFPYGIELYLGHYGPDVTGVVRFYDTSFTQSDDTWHNQPQAPGCPCSFIENGKFRESRRFTFRIDLKTGCIPDGARAIAQGATALEFDLMLSDDDEVLSGSLRYLGGISGTESVVFQRDENHQEVSASDKICELP